MYMYVLKIKKLVRHLELEKTKDISLAFVQSLKFAICHCQVTDNSNVNFFCSNYRTVSMRSVLG